MVFPNEEDAALWLRRALWSILGLAAVYTLGRALFLEVDTYDSYVYLYNASRLLGAPFVKFDDSRPWLLSIVQAPVVAFARLFSPANWWLLGGPHLLNAAMSLGTVAALVALMRQAFSLNLALLGGVLFVVGRCYVHYCANVLTDIPMTGLCVLAFWLHLRALRTRRLPSFVLAGAAFGCAIGMKFTAPPFAAAIAATELAALYVLDPTPDGSHWRPRLRVDGKRWLGVALEALATGATFIAIQAVVFVRLYGKKARTEFNVAWDAAKKLRETNYDGERWQQNLPMAVTMMSAGVIVLAGAGLLAALARPRRHDVAFGAWLVGVGGSLLFAIQHNETRYLLPVVPAVIYFALRGAEAAGDLLRAPGPAARRLALPALVAVALLVAGALVNGGAQARADLDPFFYRSIQRRAARALDRSRPPGDSGWVIGHWHTLTPATRGPFPFDEFWNTFHVAAFEFTYLLGKKPLWMAPQRSPFEARRELIAHAKDGDAFLRLNEVFFKTPAFPHGPRDQAIQLWRIHRRDLAPSGGQGRFTPVAVDAPADANGDLRVEHGRVTFVPSGKSGPWWIMARAGSGDWLDAGTATFVPGTPVVFPPETADVDSIVLLAADVSRFE